MHRLFVALRPPRPLRLQLLDVMGGVPGARWQTDDQLHLTLRFIGEVDGAQAEDIAVALNRIDHPQPEIVLAGVGTFDHKGHVNTLWAGIAANAALTTLHKRVDRALVTCGLPPEPRAFTPHITLARMGRHAGPVAPFLARTAALTSAPLTLDAFCLFESHLGSEGAVYDAVARYPLR
ncbi:RNA 2',3'-cyclic phosphodiesterase [Sphingomonas sp. ASY06-1R]|uniref:RNA 2',3'-cyclic phosphodiesterase n=1 Tax=Sphingomonas sp. ASY06-1R TaxID=3445771 RepID=UPI003FA1B59E